MSRKKTPADTRRSCSPAFRLCMTPLAFSIAIVAGSLPASSWAQETPISIAISPQPLGQALLQLGKQAGLQLFFSQETVAGYEAPAISGSLPPDEALQRLLAGTGIQFRRTGSNVTLTRAAPPADTAAHLETVTVTGERTRDEVGHDNVYEKDISNLYVDRQYMERYQGVSVGDVFAGMNGVYNADNRNGSALFPNIRGLSGNGRVPVTVDGTQQSLDVWMALRGVNNRNYVDPNLFRSIEVEKGPSMTRGIKSGIGGSVAIRTIEAEDIIEPGRTWGLELKTSTASNSVKDSYDPFSIVGKDYRDIPGAVTATPWGSPGIQFLKPQVEMHERSDVHRFNGDDRKVFLSGAYKHDVFDVMLAYSDAQRGNYFAGTKGAGKYDIEPSPTSGYQGQNMYPYLARIYAPGYEVPYTNTSAESFLAKSNWYLSNNQKIILSYSHNRQEFGEMPVIASEWLMSLVEADPEFNLARTQFQYPFPNTRINQKTFRLGYELKPESSRWVDLEMSLWRTINRSTRYQNGDSTYQVGMRDPNWDTWARCKHHPNADTDELCQLLSMVGMFDPDNPPVKTPDSDDQYKVFIGNRQDTHSVRTGLDVSNRFQLTDALALTAAGEWQYERKKDHVPVETGVMVNSLSTVSFGPASGRREEFGASVNLDWKATPRLQISTGVHYGKYWGFDDETAQRRAEEHTNWTRHRVNTHQVVAYRQLKSDDELAMENTIQQAYSTWVNGGGEAERENWQRLQNEYQAYQSEHHYQSSYQDRNTRLLYWDVNVPIELHNGKADRHQNPIYNGQFDPSETIDAQGGTHEKYGRLPDGSYMMDAGYAYEQPQGQDRWQSPDKQRSHAWSAQLAASYQLTERARIYGRLSSMARFPSILEFSNRQGNLGEFPISTKPERSQAWEVGAAYDLGSLLDSVPVADVRMGYYHNTIRDFYDRTQHVNTIQFDRKIMSGLEFQSRFDTGRFYGNLGATRRLRQDMCDADYAVQIDPVHNRYSKCMPGGFPGTMAYFSLQPKYSINLDLGTRLLEQKLDLGMRMRHHSRAENKKLERLVANGLHLHTSRSYSWEPVMLFDAYAEYNLSRSASARLSVENLTDRYYLDPLAKVPTPGPGRTVRLDLALRY